MPPKKAVPAKRRAVKNSPANTVRQTRARVRKNSEDALTTTPVLPKRRGRPPKPKLDAEQSVPVTPKTRGRPPKAIPGNEATQVDAPVPGRVKRRGRPAKAVGQGEELENTEKQDVVGESSAPKMRAVRNTVIADSTSDAESDVEPLAKSPRTPHTQRRAAVEVSSDEESPSRGKRVRRPAEGEVYCLKQIDNAVTNL
jgi:hypothetical protein